MGEIDFSQFQTFSGRLTSEHDAIDLNFKVRIGESGELEFEFDKISLTGESKFLLLEWGDQSESFREFTLSGISENGLRFETKDLILASVKLSGGREGTHIGLRASYSKGLFSWTAAESAELPLLKMGLKGFQNFGVLEAKTPLGALSMAGQTTISDPNRITGSITLNADSHQLSVEDWRRRGEELLDHVRRVMSFGSATLLRSPITEFHIGKHSEVIAWSQTRQMPAPLRTFHHLEQQPIFHAAVRSFFEPPIEVRNLFFAIEWFAMDASYNEVRLVSAMTALENLVDSNLADSDQFIQKRTDFEKTRRSLRSVIRACLDKWPSASTEDALVELNAKLTELNRRSLIRKLHILADKWGVPLDDISPESIGAAKNARDRVIHRGQYYQDAGEADADLWVHVTLVREIVVRILLTVIGYKGKYLSYVGGCHDAEFPPSRNGGLAISP